ncbi:MAG: hypothetical protein AB7E98_11965 [Pirellulales bacterium]
MSLNHPLGYNALLDTLGGPFTPDLSATEPVAVVRLPPRHTVVCLREREGDMTYNIVTAPQAVHKHVADQVVYVLGFDDVLPAGVSIFEVDALEVEVIEGDEEFATLTLDDQVPTDEDQETLWGEVVPAGRGIQVSASSGTAGVTYKATAVVRTVTGLQRGGAFIIEVRA